MGWSGALDIVEVSVQVSVKTARGQIVCSDRRPRLVLRLSGLKRNGFQVLNPLRDDWPGRPIIGKSDSTGSVTSGRAKIKGWLAGCMKITPDETGRKLVACDVESEGAGDLACG